MIHNIETGETVYDQDGGKGIRLYEEDEGVGRRDEGVGPIK